MIRPGLGLGVLGSGQLGRMFAIAARRMGYRVHTFSPDSDTPTGQVADVEVTAPYDDLDALRAFARQVDVVTFEFENVPSAADERHRVDRRGAAVARGAAHRAAARAREAVPRRPRLSHRALRAWPRRRASSRPRSRRIGTPAIVKTADSGYDGKGQQVAASADARRAHLDVARVARCWWWRSASACRPRCR